MAFEIERGLFKYDFTDYHAILGVPVDADEKTVRKQYLKVTRRLHPDSSKFKTDEEKQKANELLTKLVNPAKEQLSRGSRDYMVSLGHMGKRLASEKGKISISSDVAKQLAKAGANADAAYRNSLKSLASKQYESLDRVVDITGEISELNLVYLMLKGKTSKSGIGKTTSKTAVSKTAGTGPAVKKTQAGAAGGAATKGGGTEEVSKVDSYISRADSYMQKNNFAGAVLELREALKLEQTNSKCHGLLGLAYLKQNQVSMAKVHINKALQLNPQEENALKGKQYIEKLTQKTGSSKKPKEQSGGGGLFGGLFGGKKK
ncbi:MAG: DnaJ domain-containing protein [Coleofasciculus sp. C1-SOL-03]|jgi:curved DNA-binding protein CbpA|uniref:J domain-containing protein n=1 Tax=Coleofasciculus sp. C1-SOL-03 TaxID=3069522 RepID=UPI0032F7C53F